MGDGPVVVYGGCLANRGGTGVYVRRLLRGLTDPGGLLVATSRGLLTPKEALDGPVPVSGAVRALSDSLLMPRVASRAAPRLVHLPAFSGRPPRGVPYVVTLHDLAFLAEPAWFPPLRSVYYRLHFRRVASGAALVMVDSDFTLSEAVSRLGLDRSVLRRVYLSTPDMSSDPSAFRRESGIEGEYLLFVGTVEPRKNLGALLDAHLRIGREHPGLRLVVAGRWGWGRRSLARRLREQERVSWVGSLPPDLLASCISGARMLVYPSLYEGFGLPPLEAASAGVPSVVSPAGALTEVYGGVAGVADGFGAGDIAETVLAELECEPDREALRAFAARFTRERMASAVLDVYAEATA